MGEGIKFFWKSLRIGLMCLCGKDSYPQRTAPWPDKAQTTSVSVPRRLWKKKRWDMKRGGRTAESKRKWEREKKEKENEGGKKGKAQWLAQVWLSRISHRGWTQIWTEEGASPTTPGTETTIGPACQ